MSLIALLLFGCHPEPTFANVESQVFQQSCAFSSCHGSTNGSGGFAIGDSTYDELVDVPSEALPDEIRVIPGDPDNSYLIKKLEASPDIDEDPMPPPFGGLDPKKIALVRAWIEEGALP